MKWEVQIKRKHNKTTKQIQMRTNRSCVYFVVVRFIFFVFEIFF